MTVRRMTSRIAPALVAGLVVLGAGACGSGSGSGSGSGGGAGDVKVGDEIDASTLAKQLSTAMQEAGTGKFTGTNNGNTITGELDTKKQALTLKGSQEGESIEAILLDGVMYIGGTGIVEMTGGKKFAKIDPKADDPMSKLMAPMLDQVKELTNPNANLLDIPGLKSKVTEVKDGTTTYTTTLTGEQVWALAQKSMPSGEAVPSPDPSMIAGMGSTLVQKLDGKNRPLSFEVTTNAAGKTDKQTFTYSDWGSPVKIVAPSPSDVGVLTMPSAG